MLLIQMLCLAIFEPILDGNFLFDRINLDLLILVVFSVKPQKAISKNLGQANVIYNNFMYDLTLYV